MTNVFGIAIRFLALTLVASAGMKGFIGRSAEDGVPSEYRAAILSLMLREANETVKSLNLPEDSPLTSSKLAEAHVTPPLLNSSNHNYPAGSIRTIKHVFAFASEGKLTSVGRLDLLNHARLSNEELTNEYRRRKIPATLVDTNAGWNAILPFIRSGIVDFDRLSRDCKLEIRAFRWGEIWVPIYSAVWTREEKRVASVTVLMPENILLSFRIEDPAYNQRPSFPRYDSRDLNNSLHRSSPSESTFPLPSGRDPSLHQPTAQTPRDD